MRFTLWVSFLSCLLTLHCSRDYPLFERHDGRFPLSVGNRWKLKREVRMEFHDGIPPGSEELWIHQYTVCWDIVARDVLKGYGSYVLRNEWYEEGGERDFSLYWYTDSWEGCDGLYRIGYTWPGGVPPPKLAQGYRLQFGGKTFSTWEDILCLGFFGQLSKGDTLVEIPPRVVLEYPLEVGMEWTAYETPWSTLTKKVVDEETVVTEAGSFRCYKLKASLEFGALLLVEPTVSYEYQWWPDTLATKVEQTTSISSQGLNLGLGLERSFTDNLSLLICTLSNLTRTSEKVEEARNGETEVLQDVSDWSLDFQNLRYCVYLIWHL